MKEKPPIKKPSIERHASNNAKHGIHSALNNARKIISRMETIIPDMNDVSGLSEEDVKMFNLILRKTRFCSKNLSFLYDKIDLSKYKQP